MSIRNLDPTFKGWTKPGPLPNLERMHDIPLGDGESLDAIGGHWRLFQLKKGHRFSTDDVLTAWYGTSWCPSPRRVLDLGSGVGTVGMIAAWRLPHAHFVTVEAQEISVQLARKSADYNGILDRYDIRLGDLRDPNVLSQTEPFDLVLGSPPYFPLETGTHGDHPQKIACRFEVRGDITDYCQTAAEHLTPGGVFACVFPQRPNTQLERVEEAARACDLTILRRRPVNLREGDEPLLGLFLMARRQDLPPHIHEQTWVEPELIIRNRDGLVHPEYQAIKLSFGFPP